MKPKSIYLLIATAFLSFCQIAQSTDNGLRLGRPEYGGTGCPAGSASATLSPDQSQLSILFDSYVAEAGRVNGRSFDRKTCNVAIPVQVPNGYSLSIFKVDYRGFAAIPRGGEGRFQVEYFFAGQRGPEVRRVFPGGYNRDYTISDSLVATSMVWSACGASVNLRVNSSMYVNSNSSYDDVMASVDTVDVDSGLIYHVRLRPCR